MPQHKEPEPNREQQFKEFVKTARGLGMEESDDDLERLFKKLTPNKPARHATTRNRRLFA